MWFDCPHNQDLREGKPLFLPEVRRHLPACLRNYGIAPACGPRPGQALWPADEGAMTNQAARVLLAAMPEGYVANAIDSYIAECGGGIASARHLASHLRDGPHLQAPVVSRVFEPAPAAINSYSDGNAQLPGLFGRGGSGAWWPCRSGRPSQAETNFAHVLEEARGLALAAALRTPLLSSTRTEILGVAMAMLHEGGAQVGVDNWPAIRNIRQLLRVKAADREAFYAKVKNGDLLRLVANIESQRGPGSVVLTKVKAHTGAAEAAAGAVSATHRAGNDKADRVAKAAADMQEQPGTLAFKALHQRHQVLIGIVRSFQQLMLAIMKRRSSQDDRRTTRSLGPRSRQRPAQAEEPTFASFDTAARPAAWPRGSRLVYDQACWSMQERLERYVRELRLVQATGDSAVSWLELWVHFELKEKCSMAEDGLAAERGRSQRLARRETMMDLLARFKMALQASGEGCSAGTRAPARAGSTAKR